MTIKIATPISTLFNKTNQLAKILELSDVLEIRDVLQPVSSSLPRLYHCELSVAENWTNKEIENVLSIINKNKVSLVSFHLNSCFVKPNNKDGIFYPGRRKLTKKEIINNACKNIAKLRSELNENIIIALENNNYYSTGAYEVVTDTRFMNSLLTNLNLKLLLDIGHAEITAYNRKLNIDDYIRNFDLKKVCQVHLSRAEQDIDLYQDAHMELKGKNWQYFKKIISWCPNIKFVTIEYYQNDKKLILMLKKLKKIINEF